MNRAAAPALDGALRLFLRRLSGHSELAPDEQQAILALDGVAKLVRPNVDFVHPGEVIDRACLVATGLAARFSPMIDGRRQITALYLAGDMGDLHSLVRPRVDWALQALCASTIVEIRHADLRRLTRRFPNLAEAFWRDCEIDASCLTRWLVNCGRRDASTRLAHLICELAVRSEMAGIGTLDRFALPMSQIQIAETLGLTAVHVNRVLQMLRRENLIEYRQGVVHVPDWKRLADRAEFVPAYLQ